MRMNVMARYAKWTLLLLLLSGLFTSGFMTSRSENGDQRQRVLTYTRDMLLALRDSGVAPPIELLELTDNHLDNNKQQTHQRKRGRKGGVRQRLRRKKTRAPLPSMIVSNARSLKPKMDELRRQAKVCYEFPEACVMTITETWLNKDIPDSLLEIGGFSLIRTDRNEHSWKGKAGGIGVYVNGQWCRQHTTKDIMCNPNVELLCLSLRPFYLPREFGNVLFVLCMYLPVQMFCLCTSQCKCFVYAPPSANVLFMYHPVQMFCLCTSQCKCGPSSYTHCTLCSQATRTNS